VTAAGWDIAELDLPAPRGGDEHSSHEYRLQPSMDTKVSSSVVSSMTVGRSRGGLKPLPITDKEFMAR
jgi:hypothetical protein